MQLSLVKTCKLPIFTCPPDRAPLINTASKIKANGEEKTITVWGLMARMCIRYSASFEVGVKKKAIKGKISLIAFWDHLAAVFHDGILSGGHVKIGKLVGFYYS